MTEIDKRLQEIINTFNLELEKQGDKKSIFSKLCQSIWNIYYDVGLIIGNILGAFVFGLKDGFNDGWENWK